MDNGIAVLAYSGGLDTSALIPWLKEKYGYDVVACLIDAGRVKDIPGIVARARAAGAVEALAIDAKEEFAEHYCLPALMGNALYEDKYPLVSSLSRPLIAKKLVQTAHAFGATAVAHGCTGKGNDQVRIDVGVRSQDPSLKIIAPAREADWPSREELLDYVAAHGIPVNLTKKSPYSIDENLWGRSNECGVLEDPWVAPPDDAFQFVIDAKDAPDEAQHVIVSFEKGKPVALDGKAMGLVELIETIDAIGNAHGFGRVDMIENRLVGIKSREVYEVAGSLALITAHRELEDLVLTRDLLHFKRTIEGKLADMVYEGQWFDPLTEACKAFLFQSQERVTGDVRLKFYKGTCVPDGRRSDYSLYSYKLATYTTEDEFSHEAAAGFIQLWGLPIEIWARIGKEHGLMRELSDEGELALET
ncbi:MAG: argininosuccinate synthase [Thermoleophilia bacterium]|jgi:argininosuccinate synthase|nr:argininosuccinate synthase [Thermoleophilia bacterium]